MTHFALFLRPFSVTRRMSVRNPYKSLGYLWPDAIGQPDEIDLEILLSDAFSDQVPLIGLGKPGEAVGAGRIETADSDWKKEIQTLAGAADVVLVIPGISEGTKWEIRYLKANGLLGKCIFVMPPGAEGADWQTAASELPIWVPPYDNRGMLYTVDPAGQKRLSTDLNVKTTWALAKRINRLSPGIARFKVGDQPASRFVGWILMYMVGGSLLSIFAALVLMSVRC